METFCTVITKNYLPLARVLQASIEKQCPGKKLHVLVVDGEVTDTHLRIIKPAEMNGSPFFKEIEKKYAHTNIDFYRWALKPVLIGHLLSSGYTKVVFCDPDLYFIGNCDFIFELLDRHSVLLTPHWVDLDISKSEDCISAVLQNGLFNAGFVAANDKAKAAIHWWASMCHFKMEKSQNYFNYVDQKYLDVLPVQFPNVLILQHQGCNLASWNIQTCKREWINGKLLINKKYEPIFIHFAKGTIINILNQNDFLLRTYLDEYMLLLKTNGFDLLENLEGFAPAKYATTLYKFKHRLRIRTRLKKFFFRLAEKL
ncbi:MAG: hypothetical protein ABIT05_09830 [Chitinophagaceae bacterium]